jgi:hypothetical protein
MLAILVSPVAGAEVAVGVAEPKTMKMTKLPRKQSSRGRAGAPSPDHSIFLRGTDFTKGNWFDGVRNVSRLCGSGEPENLGVLAMVHRQLGTSHGLSGFTIVRLKDCVVVLLPAVTSISTC